MDEHQSDEAVPDTVLTDHSWKPNNPTPSFRTPMSNNHPADASVDEGEVNTAPHPSAFSTRSPVQFVLGNFFLAIFLISLIVLLLFSTVTWFTVLQDARSMSDLSDATGVSLGSCHNEWTLLMAAVEAVIDTRPWPPTGPRCMCIIRFMEGRRLWCGHEFRESALG